MTSTPAPSRRGPILTVAAIVILAIAGVGLWYLFFRPAGPAPVSLGSATPTQVAQATADAATDDPATAEPSDETGTEPAESQGTAAGDGVDRDLDGRPDDRLVQRLLELVRGLPGARDAGQHRRRPRRWAGRRT